MLSRQADALAELRSTMSRIGFYVEPARKGERTLRAYPERRHVYLLLKPHLIRASDGRGPDGDRPTLVITVLSTQGVPGLATRVLGFRPSADCRFEHVARTVGRYRQHGQFVLPLVERRGRPVLPEAALRRIRACLTSER